MFCRAFINWRKAAPQSAQGLNAPENFGDHIAKEISKITGLKFTSAPNKFAELAAHDTMVELSGALNTAGRFAHENRQ